MNNHETLKSFVNALIRGDNTCLIVHGEAGIGKSSTILEVMHELQYERSKHYSYINNFSAPRSFYDYLMRTTYLSEPNIVIMDDVEEYLKQSKIVSILRSALWSVDGKRQVNWISGNRASGFEFNGKIIMVVNRFDDKIGLLNTIRDRALYYHMEFTQDEVKELIIARASKMGVHEQEIANHVINSVRDTKLSLRDFQKAVDLSKGSPEQWKVLLEAQYRTNN